MPTCFVIQPFDGGKFDKRYSDVYKTAIHNAGFEPYRVDNDPAVSIPIQDIEDGIVRASVCLADITLDNPNVWFELGYAIASKKDICLLCSDERTTTYPFDIQHRQIIRYKTESQSDFSTLAKKIEDKLVSIADKLQQRTSLPTLLRDPETVPNLTEIEVSCIGSIAMAIEGQNHGVSHWAVKGEMEKLGYNNLAANVSLRRLLNLKMIDCYQDRDYDGEEFDAYKITEPGWSWFADNIGRFNLSTLFKNKVMAPSDKEFPF